MRRSPKSLVGLSLATALVISACSNSWQEGDDSPDAAEPGGTVRDTLTIAWPASPATLDPAVTSATSVRDIALNIFEPLVAYDENYEVQPVLAESFTVSDDGTVYTFALREGVLFHNGEEMKAADVAASLERWLGLNTQAVQFLAGSEVAVVDDYTVTLTLPQPVYITFDLLASLNSPLAIMPESVVAESTEAGVSEYIGTGPYQLGEWVTDQYIELTRFDDYVSATEPASGLTGAKTAPTETLRFEIVTDASTRASGVQSGTYDAASYLPPDNAAQLSADAGVTLYDGAGGFTLYIFNKSEGPFQDKSMRQAVNASLDMEEIESATYQEGQYTLDGGLVSPDNTRWYVDTALDQYNQNDPDRAAQLLSEAGYDGSEITILASRDYAAVYNAGVVLQQRLETIGVTANLELLDWASMLDRRNNQPETWDIAITTAVPLETNPVTYQIFTGTYAGWTDSEELQTAIQAVLESTGPDEARTAAEAVQAAYYDYLPGIKVGNEIQIEAMRSAMQGFDYLTGPIYYNASISE